MPDEVANRAAGLAPGPRGGELGEAGEALEPLRGLGRRHEQPVAPQADALDEAANEDVGPHLLHGGGSRALELEEGLDPVARLRRQLGALEGGVERRDHVELAPPRDGGAASQVDRAQLDRRARERPDDRGRVRGVGQHPQPGEHVSNLGALEERRVAREPEGNRALLERGRHQARLPPARADDHADRLGRHLTRGEQVLDLPCRRLRLRALGRRAPEAHHRGPVIALFLACAGALIPGDGGHRARSLRHLRAEPQRPVEDHVGRLRVPLHERRPRVHDGRGGTPDGLRRVARADEVLMLGHRVDERAVGSPGVLQFVDHHEGEAGGHLAAHVSALAQQPLQLDHQVAAVEAPVLAQDPVVARVQLRELPLAAGALLLLRDRRLPLALLGPVAKPAGADSLGLQGVDSPQQAGEQARRVAADLVPPEGQVVQMVEEQRQPIREPDGREEGVESRLQGVLAQQPPGGRLVGGDPELLVGRIHQSPGALPQPRRARAGARQDEDVLRLHARIGQALEPADERLAAAGPRWPGKEERTFSVADGARLELGRRLSGPRWALSLHRANASACRRACRRPG